MRRHHVVLRCAGFTLIELVVVSVIVAILALLAYPSYQSVIRKAKRSEARSALMQLMQQEERYYSQNTTYIVFSSASTELNAKKFTWFSGDNPRSSAYEISAEACKDETIQSCVILIAQPGTAKVNASFSDQECGDLALTSTGVKSASGKGADCWK